ncbi:SAM-dependent methyltransferase [Methylocystis bryophila]|uniref:SAM-dependent methyltransferase n=1 Tax=Methylocystis bryophila TaxID=655015 RepID=A0A1W6MU76_9HYPH|nr:SAM-dependent methyltransferase [Methylocystis bryophila]ARN81154.1 SAM-dependent methyltransferase [Methylocystis bryophila]BDV37087.1 trans-aconitate methyltransferase [Methylocystis bryophila]
MSGFSADWLALRESADHAARNRRLVDLVAARFADLDHVGVLDLACGTGSNLRAQAPHLPARQRWRLVDHDPQLLDAARAALIAWADRVERQTPLTLLRADRRLEIVFDRSDLARFDRNLLAPDLDLVTGAAFFDLVSAPWIEDFCAALAERRLPLYAVLSYDGRERWSPTHGADDELLAAFLADQRRDKGFGPAAGPGAAALLQDALERRGYDVETAPSPWRLGPAEKDLIRALAEGSAQAVAETGRVPAPVVSDWRASRCRAESCEIGHVDLFAQRRN